MIVPFVFIVALPLLVALVSGAPAGRMTALIGATLLIEYGAGAVRISLGIPSLLVLSVICPVAFGVITFLFTVFEMAGERSERVQRFLKHPEERQGNSSLLRSYGIPGLFPMVVIAGFYICLPVAWVLHWKTRRAAATIMAGCVIASVVTNLGTAGVLTMTTD